MKNKKGVTTLLLAAIIVAVAIVASVGVMKFGGSGETMNFGGGGGFEPGVEVVGVPVESLAVLQINKMTKTTEGSDDVEFWDLGADIKDASKSARESLDLSSGAVTDTSVPALRHTDSHRTKDLYIEGTGNYYDEKVDAWKIDYNLQTGKGVLVVESTDSTYLEATDVGTFADMDVAVAMDTGFALKSAGIYYYNKTVGDGTVYIRFELGNDEVDSELRDVVFCIQDADKDLEGDEITAMTISKYSGDSIGNMQSNILTLFSNAAGSGGASCMNVGTIEGLKKGVYQIDITFNEDNCADGEEFEIIMDDLGSAYARDYPSRNLKAAAEDVVIECTS